MQIEFQFNSVVVSEQNMDGVVGDRLFVVPSPKSLPPRRKSAKHRRKKKGSVKVANLISDVLDGIK